jgi:hypothetical protein
MPVHSAKNLYPGINPHLNSALQQNGGGWQSFHKDYITFLRIELDQRLPGAYYVASEASLQIGTYDADMSGPLNKPTLIRPDVGIYRHGAVSEGTTRSGQAPTMTIAVADTLDDEEEIASAVIYHLEEGEFPGKPVTRIELLSPANKPTGSHYVAYLLKRSETLNAGIRLVEIDFLHERRPIIAQLKSYPDRQPEAYPYSMIVNDPRPSIQEGLTDIYSFGVLDRIPVIDVPLDEEETVAVDFGEIYNRTLESSRLFREILVDYAQEPANFAAYSEADQANIRQKMAEVAAR